VNKRDILTGELLVLKRVAVFTAVIGVPGVLLDVITPVQAAMVGAGLFVLANILVGALVAFRPDVLSLMQAGYDMDEEERREAVEEMFGGGSDDE
jgi:hypothetical protein